jgi:FKBP-type peptidyl-prolyl cis-trans isomerase FkpA
MISRRLVNVCLIFSSTFVFFITNCYSYPLSNGELSGSEKVMALKVVDVNLGSGAPVVNGNKIVVHYTGWAFDERKANSRGEQIITTLEKGIPPYAFTVGDKNIIQGLSNGVVGMKVGGRRIITIPSSHGYSKQGVGAVPADSALVFEVYLLSAN